MPSTIRIWRLTTSLGDVGLSTWQYYPRSDKAPQHLVNVAAVFAEHQDAIGSMTRDLASDEVLSLARPDLLALGFQVEASKKAEGKISVPVLFGLNGRIEKSFDADAFDASTGTVIEIEAGRAVVNNQFLKDLFEACVMHDVFYLVIVVRQLYKRNPDFSRVCNFFDALFASNRLKLPLKGIMVIGY